MEKKPIEKKISTNASLKLSSALAIFYFRSIKSFGPNDRREKKCRFIEIIIAAYKMKTSSLTRYLWLLMILFIPISTESIYNRTFNRETSHIRTMLWTEDTITSTLKTWHSTCAHLICLPIEYCSSQENNYVASYAFITAFSRSSQSEPICFTIIVLLFFVQQW